MDSQKTYNWKIVILAQYHSEWSPEYKELISDIEKSLQTSTVRFLVLTHHVPNTRADKGNVVVTDYERGREVPYEEDWGKNDFYDGKAINRFFNEYVVPVKATKVAFMVWGHSAGLGYLTPKWGIKQLEGRNAFMNLLTPITQKENKQAFIRDTIAKGAFIQVDDPDTDFKEVIHAIQFLFTHYGDITNQKSIGELYFKVKGNFFKVREGLQFTSAFAEKYPWISAETLGSWLRNLQQPIDIFIASTCFCQMLESSYSLRNVARYMVAAQTTYPLFGFNYLSFFNDLQATEPLADKKLVENIVLNFPLKYTDEYMHWAKEQDNSFAPGLLKRVSISANDITISPSLVKLVDELGTFLIEQVNKDLMHLETIVKCRNECLDLVPKEKYSYGIIDLLHYVEKLNKHWIDGVPHDLKKILSKLLELKQQCNCALYGAPELYKHPEGSNASANPQFLSIFHPANETNEILKTLYRAFYNENPVFNPLLQTAWKWDEFVRFFAAEKLGLPPQSM